MTGYYNENIKIRVERNGKEIDVPFLELRPGDKTLGGRDPHRPIYCRNVIILTAPKIDPRMNKKYHYVKARPYYDSFEANYEQILFCTQFGAQYIHNRDMPV